MDPISIASAALALAGTITKVGISLTTFVRDVRDSRNDIDGVAAELNSLKTILDLLVDDVQSANGRLHAVLETKIGGVLANCTSVVNDISECLEQHEGTRIQKRARWATIGKGDMDKLRSSLEANKTTLGLALDMISIAIMQEVRETTQQITEDTGDIKADTARIIEAIERLQARLSPDDTPQSITLQRYLEELTTYAGSVIDADEPTHDFISDSRSIEDLDSTSEATGTGSGSAVPSSVGDEDMPPAVSREHPKAEATRGPAWKSIFFGVSLESIPRAATRPLAFEIKWGSQERESIQCEVPRVLYFICAYLIQEGVRLKNIFTNHTSSMRSAETRQLLEPWFKADTYTGEVWDNTMKLWRLGGSGPEYNARNAVDLLLDFLDELPEPLLTRADAQIFTVVRVVFVEMINYRTQDFRLLVKQLSSRAQGTLLVLLALLHELSTKANRAWTNMTAKKLAKIFTKRLFGPQSRSLDDEFLTERMISLFGVSGITLRPRGYDGWRFGSVSDV